MPAGTNELRINDAYLSLNPPPAGDAEEQLPPATPIFLSVDCEAGSTAFGLGIAYRLHVILLNITASYTNMFNTVVTGNLNSPAWSAKDHTFTFPIPGTPGPDTLLRIEAVLTWGVSNEGVDEFEGTTVVVVP